MSKYTNILYGDTPQVLPQFGKNQVKNNAGGYVYKADKFQILDRFLIIGTENNSFYMKSSDLTIENAKNLIDCINTDGIKTVDKIVEISDSGRAIKNNTAIFALAMCVGYGNPIVKQYALNNLSKVARIGTHLFQFVEDINKIRDHFKHSNNGHTCGWGRSLKNAVSSWYTDKPTKKLGYQLIKYKQRDGWTHQDVMRLAHPVPKNDEQTFMFNRLVKGFSIDDINNVDNYPDMAQFIAGCNVTTLLQDAASDVDKMVELIKKYDLPREVIPTNLLSSPKIWEALLDAGMPLTAMIRNLGNMAKAGILTPFSRCEKIVIDTFNNEQQIRAARIHPINVLCAKLIYTAGRGYKGNGTWETNPRISAALEDMFYAAFDNIEPTGLRYLNALDISGSMTSGIHTHPYISSMIAMAAMSMSLVRSEENVLTGVFTTKFKLDSLNKRTSLDELVNRFNKYSYDMGGTDAGVAIKYLTDNKIPVDVIFIGSDGETWAGNAHVDQMLNRYRDMMGVPTKLIFANTESNFWSLTDPKDPLTCNIVGFDAALPQLVREFSLGNI